MSLTGLDLSENLWEVEAPSARRAKRPEVRRHDLSAPSMVIENADLARRTIARPSVKRSGGVAAAMLLAADAASYALAFTVLSAFAVFDDLAARVLLLATIAVLGLYWSASIYPGYRIYAHELLKRRIVATVKIAAITAIGTTLVFETVRLAGLATVYLGLALAIQPLLRSHARTLARRLGYWGKRSVIIGDAREAALLRSYFEKNWEYGIRLDPKPGTSLDHDTLTAVVSGLRLDEEELELIRRRHAEVVLLRGVPCASVAGLGPMDGRGELGVSLGSERQPGSFGALDRILDLLVAMAALVASAPIMAIAAIAIYVVDPGPIIYRQEREGLGGKHFRIFKLRTMYQDADQRLAELLLVDEEARIEWETHFKLRRDPRIIPFVGKLLRKSSIDELPQLLNIIAGDMRIVGPRPFPPYHLAAMEDGFRIKRCSIKPGLTGLWQISERSGATVEHQQQIDGFYIDNRSIWFDMHILINTFSAVFRGTGA